MGTVVKYAMDGERLYMIWDGTGYHYSYEYVQRRAEDLEFEDAWVWQGALRFMQRHLTLEAANARYASDVQTAWARMGCRGGVM